MMKKLFFVFFVVILSVSCSSDDDKNYRYEFLPIEEAYVPEVFVYGEVYTLTVEYIRPDDCYTHSDIVYEYDFDARNIAVISTVVNDKSCNPLNTLETLTIRVQALQRSPYIFRFWQGDDENGHPIYLEIEVPVIL